MRRKAARQAPLNASNLGILPGATETKRQFV
jgi:hypothetical protein